MNLSIANEICNICVQISYITLLKSVIPDVQYETCSRNRIRKAENLKKTSMGGI